MRSGRESGRRRRRLSSSRSLRSLVDEERDGEMVLRGELESSLKVYLLLLIRYLSLIDQALVSYCLERVPPSFRPLPHPNLSSKLSGQHQHVSTQHSLRNSTDVPSLSNSSRPPLSKRFSHVLALEPGRTTTNHVSLQLRLLLPISENGQHHRRFLRLPSSSWTSLSSLLDGSLSLHLRHHLTLQPSTKSQLPPVDSNRLRTQLL